MNIETGAPWRMIDGRWTVDRLEIRVDRVPNCSIATSGSTNSEGRITKQDIDEFGAIVGCPGCKAIKDNIRAQAHSYRCSVRIEECLRIIPQRSRKIGSKE